MRKNYLRPSETRKYLTHNQLKINNQEISNFPVPFFAFCMSRVV